MIMNRLMTVVVLLLATAATAQKPDNTITLFPDARGLSGFPSEFEANLKATGLVSAIAAEINALSTRELLAASMSIDSNQALLPRFVITNTVLHCYRNGTETSAYNAVMFRMYWYAASRLDGHSVDYARDNLRERKGEMYRDPRSPEERTLSQHQDCPPSWLQTGPGQDEFHVTDGNAAWIYSRGIGWPGFDYFCFSSSKHHPREVQADFRALLKQVETEAEANLAAKGIKRQFGYCHVLWAEMKRILKEKHSIPWRTPQEQNPDILYD